jgi:hypothetical protein
MIPEITEIAAMEIMYTMGHVAKEAGVTKNTLATWERNGKVPRVRRERGGNQARAYTADELKQVVDFARSRKELIDPPMLSPTSETKSAEKKMIA